MTLVATWRHTESAGVGSGQRCCRPVKADPLGGGARLVDSFDLFVSLAEISGIFVGFGALIGIGRRSEIERTELGAVRGVVTVGLVVLVAALIPVLITSFGIEGQSLWRLTSLLFLVIIWVVIALPLRSARSRDEFLAAQKASPIAAAFFWLVLEASIQLPLIFNVIGLRPDLAPAFYTTALVINLAEAAFLLAAVVLTDRETS